MASEKKGISAEPGLTGLNKISVGTTFKGDIVSDGDFRIDGRFEGTITTGGRIVVGKDGSIDGTIDCSNAEVEGAMSGVMNVNDVLSVKSSGRVSGTVRASRLAIELGAVFDVTSCEMKGQRPSGLAEL